MDRLTAFKRLVQAVARAAKISYPLAELNDLLASASGPDIEALPAPLLEDPYRANYVAAMVELAAHRGRRFAARLDRDGATTRSPSIHRSFSEPASASPHGLSPTISPSKHLHWFERWRSGLTLSVERMCLVFRARQATKDIDALLIPAAELRRAAQRVGQREGLEDGWLNDAVKGFFSASGRFEVYQEFSHLKVFAPHPEYLLAMKCLAMRLGEVPLSDPPINATLLTFLGAVTVHLPRITTACPIGNEQHWAVCVFA
jgi:hypothetical protein